MVTGVESDGLCHAGHDDYADHHDAADDFGREDADDGSPCWHQLRSATEAARGPSPPFTERPLRWPRPLSLLRSS